MKRKTKTTLLLVGAGGIFALMLAGQLAELGNWFGILMLALMGGWLWAAARHWPNIFGILYGGGSLEDAERDVRDEK